MSFPSSSKTAKRRQVTGVVLPLALLVTTTQAQDESQWGSGKDLYDKVCAYCHDPEVGVGTALAGRELPEIYVRAILRSGLNAMPAFPTSFIDDESVAQVTEYLSTLPAPAAQD